MFFIDKILEGGSQMASGSFSFNGIRKDYIFILMGFNRPAFAPLNREIIKVNGLAGGHLIRTNTDVRKIEVPVILRADNQANLQKKKEDLADWLITDDPKELIFDDEPDRTYLAVVDDSADLDELVFRGKGKITFVCTMPYKLGATINKTFAAAGQDFKTNFTNKGTVESFPIITVKTNAQSPHLDVWNGSEYFRLGYPTGIKTKIVQQAERLLWDELKTLTGWTAHTGALGDCMGGGTMVLNGSAGFKASSYGTGSAWHGAIMKKTIPNVGTGLTNFKVDIRMTLKTNHWSEEGKVIVWLLDANDVVVTQIEIADAYPSVHYKNPEVKAGAKILMGDWDNYNISTNQFVGHMTVQRAGNKWIAYIGNYRVGTQIDDFTSYEDWIDTGNTEPATTRPVSKIAVGVMQYGTDTPCQSCSIDDVKVWKLNNVQVDEMPYIFDIGDTIVIDSERSLVTINGVNAINVKDIFSRFPVVKRGVNDIIVRPSNIGTATLTYRERYR